MDGCCICQRAPINSIGWSADYQKQLLSSDAYDKSVARLEVLRHLTWLMNRCLALDLPPDMLHFASIGTEIYSFCGGRQNSALTAVYAATEFFVSKITQLLRRPPRRDLQPDDWKEENLSEDAWRFLEKMPWPDWKETEDLRLALLSEFRRVARELFPNWLPELVKHEQAQAAAKSARQANRSAKRNDDAKAETETGSQSEVPESDGQSSSREGAITRIGDLPDEHGLPPVTSVLADTQIDLPHGDAKTPEGTAATPPMRPRTPRREVNAAVREYLAEHKEEAKAGKVTIRMIRAETGFALASICKTDAWRAYHDAKPKLPRKAKSVRLSPAMLKSAKAKIQSEDPDRDEELDQLMAKQERDMRREDGYGDNR